MGLGALGMAAGGRLLGQTAPSAVDQTLKYPELKFINLAGNENPFGPSRRVTMAIMKEVRNVSRYPFREEVILTEKIAEKEGVEPENILLGIGCDEILSLTSAAFAGPGTSVVATRPTYLQLMEQAEKRGAHVYWVDHDKNMRHDLDRMLEVAKEHASELVYVCNPDTPSGTIRSASDIESFCKKASEGATVFLDEVYLDLLDDFEKQTQVELVRQGYPVIVGRSFSKMHGLAGSRIGYAIATPEIIEKLGKNKMTSPSYLGVTSAIASVDDVAFHAQSRRLIGEGRERFCGLLDRLNLHYTPSVGNFVFHHTGIEIREYQKVMKAHGFLVGRPFPPYEDWCRISIGTNEEMAAYEKAMLAVHL